MRPLLRFIFHTSSVPMLFAALGFLLTAWLACQPASRHEAPGDKSPVSMGEGPPSLNVGARDSLAPVVIDVSSVERLDTLLQRHEVRVGKDYTFKTSKQYEGFSLRELLAPYLQRHQLSDSSEALLTFICSDGYAPSQKLSDALQQEGYLAFRDLALGETEGRWPDSLAEKFQPFYLVWEHLPADDQLMVWPFGLVRIELRLQNDLHDAIRPVDDPDALAGFDLYEHHCLKCHSINKVGGKVGPEFNYPKNILEYWEVEHIWAYAKDPRSFRYNARMYPIRSLSRDEFDAIIAYLGYMRAHKLP